ncbi:MAG: alkyl sulfatase C-terminal domain-containing protein [Sphingomonas sp.]
MTVTIANGVLTHRPGAPRAPVDATLTVAWRDFLASLVGGVPLAPKVASGEAAIAGDATAFGRLVGWLDRPDPGFAIVTP